MDQTCTSCTTHGHKNSCLQLTTHNKIHAKKCIILLCTGILLIVYIQKSDSNYLQIRACQMPENFTGRR